MQKAGTDKRQVSIRQFRAIYGDRKKVRFGAKSKAGPAASGFFQGPSDRDPTKL